MFSTCGQLKKVLKPRLCCCFSSKLNTLPSY